MIPIARASLRRDGKIGQRQTTRECQLSRSLHARSTANSPFMARVHCREMLAIIGFLSGAPLPAQVPWSVTLSAAVNPLPIGNCSSVYITLKDETGKDAPRNPAGTRVSIADFDMTASAPDPRSVVGVWNGPNAWSVCGCQGSAIGTPVTLTASYPAKLLAEKSRVPGVAFQAALTIPMSKAYGTNNPTGCDGQKTTIVDASNAKTSTTTTSTRPASPANAQPRTTASGAQTTCATGQTVNGSACVNLPAGAPCATGVADGGGACVAPQTMTCSTGQTAKGNSCVNLPAGAPCATGVADGGGVCVAPQTMTCSTGQTAKGNSCVNLPAGAPCATGVADGGGVCVAPQTMTCSTGQTAKGNSCVNLPAGAPCATGVANGAGVCLAPQTMTCSMGQTPKGNSCVNLPTGAPCPTGVANGAGVCVAPQAMTCTTGQTPKGSTCVNLPVGAPCATGVADGAGVCVAPQTMTCSMGQTPKGSTCVNLPAGAPCPTGVANGAGGCVAPPTEEARVLQGARPLTAAGPILVDPATAPRSTYSTGIQKRTPQIPA